MTIVAGWCLQSQWKVQRSLESGGVVVYRTIDSSPQGAYDWVMHGSRMIRADEIVQCFEAAHSLIQGTLEARRRDDDFQGRPHLDYLEPRLEWTQGMPASVGSGRCSALHKIHAVFHSEPVLLFLESMCRNVEFDFQLCR